MPRFEENSRDGYGKTSCPMRDKGQAIAYTRAEIIERMEEYILNHLSVKHPTYSNLPPCPFAKAELEKKAIAYIFADLREPPSFVVELEQNTTDSDSTVILVHEGEYISRYQAESYCDDLLVLWAKRNPTLFRSSKARLNLFQFIPNTIQPQSCCLSYMSWYKRVMF